MFWPVKFFICLFFTTQHYRNLSVTTHQLKTERIFLSFLHSNLGPRHNFFPLRDLIWINWSPHENTPKEESSLKLFQSSPDILYNLPHLIFTRKMPLEFMFVLMVFLSHTVLVSQRKRWEIITENALNSSSSTWKKKGYFLFPS